MAADQSLFLLRHGERLDYVDSQWQRKFKDCHSDDPPLAPNGRIQAEEAGRRLCNECFDYIITSPFQRCVETAAIVANAVQKPILVEPGICEILWTFPPGYTSAKDLKFLYPLIDVSYHQFWTPEKKERFDTDCFPRVANCMQHLVDKFSDSNILLVSHRGTIAGIFKRFVGRPYFVGLCTFSRLGRFGNVWKVHVAGDSSHLSVRCNLRAY